MNLDRITPIKALGQNFLKDKNLANKIVDLLGDISAKNIVEIGPGMGALTDILIEKKANVFAIEKDKRAFDYLTQKYSGISNFNVVNSDVREVNLFDLDMSELYVIGNIPYNISTDILFWTFDFASIVKNVVLTVQREVAERICALPRTKDYGVTTIATKLYGKAKIAFHLPPSVFFPPPKVVSSALRIEFDDTYENIDKKEVMRLIKAVFLQRRKMINNSIRPYLSERQISIEKLTIELESRNLNYLKQRPEELQVDDFINLYNIINEAS